MRTVFFHVWFAFVAVVVCCMLAGVVFVGYSVYKTGPAGIGRAAGQIVKGYNDAAHARSREE